MFKKERKKIHFSVTRDHIHFKIKVEIQFLKIRGWKFEMSV